RAAGCEVEVAAAMPRRHHTAAAPRRPCHHRRMSTRPGPTHAARRSRLAIGCALAVGIVALAGLAIAQQPRRKLHEDLPITDPKPSPLIGGAGSGNPAAFQSGGKLLTEPSDETRKAGEPVFGKGGFAADRETSMTPDGNT